MSTLLYLRLWFPSIPPKIASSMSGLARPQKPPRSWHFLFGKLCQSHSHSKEHFDLWNIFRHRLCREHGAYHSQFLLEERQGSDARCTGNDSMVYVWLNLEVQFTVGFGNYFMVWIHHYSSGAFDHDALLLMHLFPLLGYSLRQLVASPVLLAFE